MNKGAFCQQHIANIHKIYVLLVLTNNYFYIFRTWSSVQMQSITYSWKLTLCFWLVGKHNSTDHRCCSLRKLRMMSKGVGRFSKQACSWRHTCRVAWARPSFSLLPLWYHWSIERPWTHPRYSWLHPWWLGQLARVLTGSLLLGNRRRYQVRQS